MLASAPGPSPETAASHEKPVPGHSPLHSFRRLQLLFSAASNAVVGSEPVECASAERLPTIRTI